MTLALYQVDAFTTEAFKGNPAAVTFLQNARPDAWMQSLAMEMNLSETAFLLPEADGYRLRWFTPAAEVRLCGHATLASAHVLFETGRLAAEAEARFYTLSGLLTARQSDGWLELNFPARQLEVVEPQAGLIAAMGVQPIFAGMSRNTCLLELESEEAVRNAAPDMAALKKMDAHGVMVTSRAESGPYDFVSRFFAPRIGVDEDPVTGSAHCVLTPYWAAKLGKNEMLAYQASARGGEIRVRLDDERVLLSGKAVTVMQGELDA